MLILDKFVQDFEQKQCMWQNASVKSVENVCCRYVKYPATLSYLSGILDENVGISMTIGQNINIGDKIPPSSKPVICKIYTR